jgi:lipopolysaccharide biosynthesis protein
LLSAFAANESVAADCLQCFRNDPEIGIIGAAAWRNHAMGLNQENCDWLFDRFGIARKNRRLDFVGGTMFLIRSEIVARLYEGLREVDWEDAAGRGAEFFLDGQIEHAIERLIPSLARQMGYRIEWR